MWKIARLCAMTSALIFSMTINGYTQDEMVNGVRTINNVVYEEPFVIEITTEPLIEEEPVTEVIQTTYSGVSISDEERVLLDKIVAAESQIESVTGRMAVAEVIFNRVLDDRFPDTVKGVLSQKGQFATWKLRDQSWVVPSMATEAVNTTISAGLSVLPSTEYVIFSTSKMSYGYDYIKIGHHWFGKLRR